MTYFKNDRQREAAKRQIDDLERKRNATPNGPERDALSEQLDDARDVYEDRL